MFIFNISSDVIKEEIEALMSRTDNGVVVKQMICMTKKDNPSDCYHVTAHCYDITKIFDCDFWWEGVECITFYKNKQQKMNVNKFED